MNFTELFQKLKKTVFSKLTERVNTQTLKTVRKSSSERNLQFDLFAQLSYMSSISSSGVSRSELFDFASRLPYSTSNYFRRIHLLAQKLNIDYAEGCRLVAERTNVPEIKSYLLRLAGSLSSGEDESEFLMREAEHVANVYQNQYDRDVESLKKWADAYVTLVVAAGLIVIVSVISMMIYEVGVPIVVGLAMTMVFVTCLGSWIIYASAPREIKTRVQGASSKNQVRSIMLFKALAPLAAIVCSFMVLGGVNLGYVMLVGGVLLFPSGFLMNKDDGILSKKDMDLPTVVRVLGAVTSAIGTTVTEALDEVDRRSFGSMVGEMDMLRFRLVGGISPQMCWDRLVEETGSELIERTMNMFYDAISLGGESKQVGIASSFYAAKIAFLRSNRTMVAATFKWLVLPLHLSMVGLLVFIPQVMGLFSKSIEDSAEEISSGSSLANSDIPIGEIFTFGQVNMSLVTTLVTIVVLVLTISNSFAPKAAEGGSNLKVVYNLAVNMFITGILMIAVPAAANGLFQSITEI